MAARDYHHGNLRQALLDAAVEEIAAVGPSAMSLRKVAARVGVTHPAASHHFGDKTGLLTAVAALGFRRFATTLAECRASGGELMELGLVYLEFAHEHRAYFEVMFRPELLQLDDAELAAARADSLAQLAAAAGPRPTAHQRRVAVGAWSFAHGFTTLWLGGNLPVASLAEAKAEFRRSAVAFSMQPIRTSVQKRAGGTP